jgi:hypothetical protein
VSIGVKIRYEILKRDRFTCSYCGAHPPDVLLEIDHEGRGRPTSDGELVEQRGDFLAGPDVIAQARRHNESCASLVGQGVLTRRFDAPRISGVGGCQGDSDPCRVGWKALRRPTSAPIDELNGAALSLQWNGPPLLLFPDLLETSRNAVVDAARLIEEGEPFEVLGFVPRRSCGHEVKRAVDDLREPDGIVSHMDTEDHLRAEIEILNLTVRRYEGRE